METTIILSMNSKILEGINKVMKKISYLYFIKK